MAVFWELAPVNRALNALLAASFSSADVSLDWIDSLSTLCLVDLPLVWESSLSTAGASITLTEGAAFWELAPVKRALNALFAASLSSADFSLF